MFFLVASVAFGLIAEGFLYTIFGLKGGSVFMPTKQKGEKIEVLSEKLSRATVTILVQTQGLNVKDMNDLRSKMRAAKLEFQVVKNTLLRIATERNSMTELDKSIFHDQTAIALSYGDEVAAAKAVSDYVRSSKVVKLKSAILGGRALNAEQVDSLGKLPGGKQQAQAEVVGYLQGPLATAYSLFTAPLRDLCYVLQARAEQLNGEQPSS